jgi:hypothetical protein
MIVAASVALGRKWTSGVSASAAKRQPDGGEGAGGRASAPASKFTTDRAKPPVTG